MATRSGMSGVKFRVRMNALLLCEFTAEQMVRITGLKSESVRTELQRMKQEGLLEVIRGTVPADQKRKRGGQSVLYKLVPDSEKRLALSRSVETFYPENPRPPQPTSRHYHLALRLLDQGAEATDDHKRDLLHEAEEELDFALSEEGASRAPEPVRAHIEFQRGRLAYLREQYEQAAESFSLARRALAAAGQIAEAARAEEFILCTEICRHWKMGGDERPQARVRRLLEVLEPSGLQANRPLVQLMVALLYEPELSQTPQDEVIEAAQQIRAASYDLRQAGDRVLQYGQYLMQVIELSEPIESQQMLNSKYISVQPEELDLLFPVKPRSKAQHPKHHDD